MRRPRAVVVMSTIEIKLISNFVRNSSQCFFIASEPVDEKVDLKPCLKIAATIGICFKVGICVAG